MGSGRSSVKNKLREYLEQRAPGRIDEQEWLAIQKRFSSATPGYLRRLLRASGVGLAPLVEGVRQDNLEELERTLVALEREYTAASGDAIRRTECRRVVIEAKNHARFALRRAHDPEARQTRQEMINWMLVWLENPPLFPAWVKMRRKRMRNAE